MTMNPPTEGASKGPVKTVMEKMVMAIPRVRLLLCAMSAIAIEQRVEAVVIEIDTALGVYLQHIGEYGGYAGKGASAKEAAPESTYQYRLQVLPYSDGYAKNRESKGGYHERQSSALELRQRRPEDGSSCEALQHVNKMR